MTHYMRDGNRYQVAPDEAIDIAPLLPLGTYKVGYAEPFDRYFLEKIEDFEGVGKVYGKTIVQRDRILRTFDDRDGGTGVMLSGEKGSGKTLLAKLLALEAQEKGMPTIVINQPWKGDTFNSFIQSIEQPVVVVFDEFEKVYNAEAQEKLLTLLDGVYTSKKLFILTCNDRYKVNTHMRNRPGRIFYRIDFGGLDAEFIREYCTDQLADQERVEEVVRISMLFARFNFDILKALVEEMNRFDESAEDALALLNAKPELGEKLKYAVALFDKGGEMVSEKRMYRGGEWTGNPLLDEVQVYYRTKPKPKAEADPLDPELLLRAPNPWDDDEDDDDGTRSVSAVFRPTDLKQVDAETGVFRFENRDGLSATLREVVNTRHDYSIVY